jgi:hypothetical protein
MIRTTKLLRLDGLQTAKLTEVIPMTRNQWTWLLVAATLILAIGVIAQLFWPPAAP